MADNVYPFGGARDGASASVGPDGITLKDLGLLRVPVSWHEGVALLLETLASARESNACPNPSATLLTESGAVHILQAPPLYDPPVQAAAALLKELIGSTSMPPELKGLIDRNASDAPEHQALSDFVRAIGYFERPNRRADVAAVFVRAREAYAKATADSELQRLRANAAAAAPLTQPHDKQKGRTGWSRPVQWAAMVVLAAVIAASSLALIAVAFGAQPASLLQPSSIEAGASQAATLVRTAQQTVSTIVKTRTLPAGLFTSEASAPAPVTAKGSATPARRAGAGRRTGASGAAQALETQAPAATPDVESMAAPASTEILAPAPAEAAAPDARLEAIDENAPIFTGSDPSVSPAWLLYPQLPTPPPGSAAHRFDLVISPSGDVERVKLVAASDRLNDRMLIAAAKAWKFSPAMRDGQPVRYRLELAIVP